MIIDNRSTESGDVLLIETDVPVLGIAFLSGFLDSTEGEDSNLYFVKKFRYSVNLGKTYTDWIPLTAENLQNLSFGEKDWVTFNYAYQHVGLDGPLYFNWVQLDGQLTPGSDVIYKKTDFSQFFDVNDVNVLRWAFNVLEKLYVQGVLPKYIKRDYTENSKDFISYWLSITHMFALIVYMSRQFLNIPSNPILFSAFLESRGIVLTGNETLSQKEYLFSNYIDEYRKRGTKYIMSEYGTSAEPTLIMGEFLRLIEYNKANEFLYFNLVRQDIGWCVGYSSPTWKNTSRIVNATKGYEFGDNTAELDVDKYPLVGNVTVVEKEGKKWLKFPASDGENGIKLSGSVETALMEGKIFRIAPALAYEISFRVMGEGEGDDNLQFGVQGYDENYSQVNFKRLDDQSVNWNSFFAPPQPPAVCILKENTTYWFRAIIMGAATRSTPGAKLNFLNGEPLIQPVEVKYFSPVITQNYTAGCKTLYINDVKVKPFELPFTQGYIGVRNIVVSYFYNLSGRSEAYVKRFIQQYLLSYKDVFVSDILKDVVLKYFWVKTIADPESGGVLTGAGTYSEGTIVRVGIETNNGYTLEQIVVQEEGADPISYPPSNFIDLAPLKTNNTVTAIFTSQRGIIVTSGSTVSLAGTQFQGGSMRIAWGDGTSTDVDSPSETAKLQHTYSGGQASHTIYLGGLADLTSLVCPSQRITSITLPDYYNVRSIDCRGNLITNLNIGSQINLASLHCENNQLSNLNLSADTNLTTVYAGSNCLTTVNVSNLKKLSIVNLDNNNISSFIDTGAIINTLSINNNRLSSLPSSLGTMKSLSISNNLLTALSISNNTSLNTLICSNSSLLKTVNVIRNNNLTTIILLNDNALSTIDISDNRINNISSNISSSSATSLKCTNNPITTVNGINIPSLLSLNCSSCDISVLEFGQAVNITTLDASYNNLENSWDDVQVLTRLVALNMSNNNLNDVNLENNTNLTFVDASHNKFTWAGNIYSPTVNIRSCEKLQTLDISFNLFTKIKGGWFGGSLTSLQQVNISNNNNLSEFTVGWNETKFSVLSVLDLSNNPVLYRVYSFGGNLSSLSLTNDNRLEDLRIDGGILTQLILTPFTSLHSLEVQRSQITTLNYPNQALNYFVLTGMNSLTSLTLSKSNVAPASGPGEKISITSCAKLVSVKNLFSALSQGAQYGSLTLNNNAALVLENMRGSYGDVTLSPCTKLFSQTYTAFDAASEIGESTNNPSYGVLFLGNVPNPTNDVYYGALDLFFSKHYKSTLYTESIDIFSTLPSLMRLPLSRNTRDISGNGYNATTRKPAAYYSAGFDKRNCIDFIGGDNYVRLNDNSKVTGDFLLSLNFFPMDGLTNNVLGRLVSGGGLSLGYGIRIYEDDVSNHNISCWMTKTDSTDNVRGGVNKDDAFIVNGWNNLIVMISAGTPSAYLNGKPFEFVGGSISGINWSTVTANLVGGGMLLNNVVYFTGYFEDYSLYINAALFPQILPVLKNYYLGATLACADFNIVGEYARPTYICSGGVGSGDTDIQANMVPKGVNSSQPIVVNKSSRISGIYFNRSLARNVWVEYFKLTAKNTVTGVITDLTKELMDQENFKASTAGKGSFFNFYNSALTEGSYELTLTTQGGNSLTQKVLLTLQGQGAPSYVNLNYSINGTNSLTSQFYSKLGYGCGINTVTGEYLNKSGVIGSAAWTDGVLGNSKLQTITYSFYSAKTLPSIAGVGGYVAALIVVDPTDRTKDIVLGRGAFTFKDTSYEFAKLNVTFNSAADYLSYVKDQSLLIELTVVLGGSSQQTRIEGLPTLPNVQYEVIQIV